MSLLGLLPAVAVAAGVTFGLRLGALLLVDRFREHPDVARLGAMLPGGIMLILVAYTVVQPSGQSRPAALWTAMAVTVAVHLWRRNTLLSILVGICGYGALAAWWG